MIVLQTTVPDPAVGKRMADKLLEDRLAGCIWIMPAMTAHYVWEGKPHQDEEHLVVVKTLAGSLEAVVKVIREVHPYDCPEIASFSPEWVLPEYLSWLGDVIRPQEPR